ncbi:hypothetical protein PV08_10236 [Exophiala spinifera]|uniref:BTB domain-containing protein n=1 Tax=Exophiala spinifera TaxID=91928 RepID=A0A0D1ZD83_9EURO|nr:uncharacterized protein PV08_10236 [Exophiala spinifera]KIW10937.1 hypothetical protein PV08_10236 [Exophiala spinifera]
MSSSLAPRKPRSSLVQSPLQSSSTRADSKTFMDTRQDGMADGQGEVSQSFARSPIVTMIVGPGKVEYTAHKAKLIEASLFFLRCFGVGMKEARTNKITLPEDDAVVFGHFIDWVYYSKTRRVVNTVQSIRELLKAWLLADKFCMPRWQNSIIESLADFWIEFNVAPSAVMWVAEHVPTHSPLFAFVVEQFSWDLARCDSPDELGEDLSRMDDLLANSTFSSRILWTSMAVAKEKYGGNEPTQAVQEYYVPL